MKEQITKVSLKKLPALTTNTYRVTVTELLTDEIKVYTVRTNRDGEGLWINGIQVRGTCQFSAGKRPDAAIRKYFTEYMEA